MLEGGKSDTGAAPTARELHIADERLGLSRLQKGHPTGTPKQGRANRGVAGVWRRGVTGPAHRQGRPKSPSKTAPERQTNHSVLFSNKPPSLPRHHNCTPCKPGALPDTFAEVLESTGPRYLTPIGSPPWPKPAFPVLPLPLALWRGGRVGWRHWKGTDL